MQGSHTLCLSSVLGSAILASERLIHKSAAPRELPALPGIINEYPGSCMDLRFGIKTILVKILKQWSSPSCVHVLSYTPSEFTTSQKPSAFPLLHALLSLRPCGKRSVASLLPLMHNMQSLHVHQVK